MKNLMPKLSELSPINYDDIKCDSYETVLNSMLEGFESSDKPVLVQISGIPGAGKSYYSGKLGLPYIYIAFDRIMEALPEYQADVEKLGSVEAFAKWELVARSMGYELLKRAINTKKNILFEHSGVNPHHVNLFNNVKKLGYSTKVTVINCPPEVALIRVKEREKITKRHTPEKLIYDRYELLNQYSEIYKKIADEFEVLDNSSYTA